MRTTNRLFKALRPLALALSIVVLPAGVAAQVAGALPLTTQLPASTRAMALGDSYQMSAGHADAIFYHPALLAGASGFGLDVQRWSIEGSAVAASAAVSWLGGGVGIGLRSLQYRASGSGELAAPGGQDHLFEAESVPVSERVATLGYAREAFLGIDVGVALSLVEERVGPSQHGVALVDVGLSREVGPVTVGLTVHDLGEKPLVETGSEPSRVTLGVGRYGRPLGPLDVGFAANMGVDDDEFTYGGGVELGYWPIQGRTFVARFGFEDVPEGSDASVFTTGLAYWGDDISIEWAFRPVSDADEGGTHRFGVRWR
ncbi:MAG: hypothetical protein OEN56_00335 [Gemmatimonadota bacterium]|nr:hypothetical protein [Gemmatimonadota bacterium]